MNKRHAIGWLAALLLLGLAIAFHPEADAPSAEQGRQEIVHSSRGSNAPIIPTTLPPPPPPSPKHSLAEVEPAPTGTNWLERVLIHGEMPEPPSPEQIQAWLQANQTNAASLLALRQSGAGRDFLKQALEKYPNDPRVLVGALALDDTPEDRRERLDRFKEVAPDNALADYVSAREHFKSGEPQKGIEDLIAASGKSNFDDYMVDAVQNTEELYLAMGKSPAEAKVLACSSALLPHLSQLRDLTQSISSMQSDYIAAGDFQSAEALAAYGLQLSQDLATGGGSKTLVGQLVGIATERIVLNALDPATQYDFLNGTPAARLRELDQAAGAIRESAKRVEAWLPTASDRELINYFERLKLFGERGALAWFEEKFPASP